MYSGRGRGGRGGGGFFLAKNDYRVRKKDPSPRPSPRVHGEWGNYRVATNDRYTRVSTESLSRTLSLRHRDLRPRSLQILLAPLGRRVVRRHAGGRLGQLGPGRLGIDRLGGHGRVRQDRQLVIFHLRTAPLDEIDFGPPPGPVPPQRPHTQAL